MTADTREAQLLKATNMAKPSQAKTDASILEYFLSQVQVSLLNEWRTFFDESQGDADLDEEAAHRITSYSDRTLRLANSFLAHYSTAYPNTPLAPLLQLRLIIARFLAIFIRGVELSTPFTPPAQKVAFTRFRERDSLRASRWLRRRETSYGQIGNEQLYDGNLYRACATALGRPDNKARKGQWRAERRRGEVHGPGRLLDALPVFVTLSARFSDCANCRCSRTWMKTLEFFMRLASTEAFLFEAPDTLPMDVMDTLKAAFSYGAVLGVDMTPTEVLHAELFSSNDEAIRLEMEEGKRKELQNLPEDLPLNLAEWRQILGMFEERIMPHYISNVCASVGLGDLAEFEGSELREEWTRKL